MNFGKKLECCDENTIWKALLYFKQDPSFSLINTP